MVEVHEQVAHAGAEVKEEGPAEHEHDELDDDVREEALEDLEAEFGGEALVEQEQDEREEQE
ncbi:hypothetical protein PT2222_110358 [Paraburkholderia tropica]